MDLQRINEIGKQYLDKIEALRKRHKAAAERYIHRIEEKKIEQLRATIAQLKRS